MFTEEEIQFFIENAGKFGEWEPQNAQPGDWIWNGARAQVIKFSPKVRQRKPMLYEAWLLRQRVIPLFTLGQLLTMLGEEGLRVVLHILPSGESKARAYWPRYIGEGPTPLIAIGRALMEVCTE